MTIEHLAEYLSASAARFPHRAAVVEPNGATITYADLNRHADALASFLATRGIGAGDRVAVVLPKSIPAVVSLFGIMKAAAAYVPVDYQAPPDRCRAILRDCGVRAMIIDSRCRDIADARDAAPVDVIVVGSEPAAAPDPQMTRYESVLSSAPLEAIPRATADDLAYILYTSGSTGLPKGVMISHANAVSFVDWSSSVFAPTESDRFSSHAPFHFDLSIFDIYVAIKHGATLYLIPDDLGKNPRQLARYIAEHRLTVWYSTPSILTLLVQLGILEAYDFSSLRLVLFAGEVFPVKHLRQLQQRWPHPAYYNLYGPTETNVCTFARIPSRIPDERDIPYPIGFPCSHCAALVLDEEGAALGTREEGLLYISGPSVFSGYWNRPVESATVFLERDGTRWYNTGDVVRWVAGDGFTYVGRRDRMVKRRGYRIELGEIEAALYLHPAVREVAVISIPDPSAGVKIIAFTACRNLERPSIIELKTFCATRLPAYMVPDLFIFRERLPRTPTDKVDYQALAASPAADARDAHAT